MAVRLQIGCYLVLEAIRRHRRLPRWSIPRRGVAHRLAEIGCIRDGDAQRPAGLDYRGNQILNHRAWVIDRPLEPAPLLTLVAGDVDLGAAHQRDQSNALSPYFHLVDALGPVGSKSPPRRVRPLYMSTPWHCRQYLHSPNRINYLS